MKKISAKAVRPAEKNGREQEVRPAVKIAMWITCLACLGLVMVVHFVRKDAAQRAEVSSSEMAQAVQPAQSTHRVITRPIAQRLPESDNGAAATWPAQIGSSVDKPEPLPATRQLVDSLVHLNPAGVALTDAQTASWKNNLKSLVEQGDSAVPAIREFLAKKEDAIFGQDEQAKLGYASPRAAMIDALTQIGSSDATAALVEVLQGTTEPSEIALVAQDLEKLQPGVYQESALNAARQMLAKAAGGTLPGVDVAPLFQVLQQYGGANAVADLEGSAKQWNFYAPIALAQLPDGAGIPSLVQIATGQQGNGRTVALELIAGAASQSTAAQDALLDQARQNKLSSYDWAALVPFLAGNQMVFQNSGFDNGLGAVNPNDLRKTMISYGNQSFYTAPLAALTAQQINQQQALIGQLESVTKDPSGIQALQQAKTLLENRLGLLANSSAN